MNFVIGDPVIQEENPKDTYRLYIYSMSGDADCDHDVHSDFKTADPDRGKEYLKRFISFLNAFLVLPWNAQSSACDDMVGFAEEKGFDIDENDILDIIPSDVTNVERYSHVKSYSVTYFDDKGVERSIKIEK